MISDNGLSRAIDEASNCDAFMEELEEFFVKVNAEVASYNPRCLGGGTCCRFDVADHRLYVSTGELARLLSDKPVDISRCKKKRCPYQVSNRCLAREKRPLGCRMFFCDKKTEKWSQSAYEKFHAKLKKLHEKYKIEYFYCELTSAIASLE